MPADIYGAYVKSLAGNTPAGLGAAPMAPATTPADVISSPEKILGTPSPAVSGVIPSFGAGAAQALSQGIGHAFTQQAAGVGGSASPSLGRISGPLDSRWNSLTPEQKTTALMQAIARGESGGNYTAKNPHASASGAYQFIDSTWNGYGGYQHASQAPAAVQDAKARQMIGAYLAQFGYNPQYVVNAWYAGPGNAQRPESWYPGGPNNGLTLGRNYAAKVAYLNAAIAAILGATSGGGGRVTNL